MYYECINHSSKITFSAEGIRLGVASPGVSLD